MKNMKKLKVRQGKCGIHQGGLMLMVMLAIEKSEIPKSQIQPRDQKLSNPSPKPCPPRPNPNP